MPDSTIETPKISQVPDIYFLTKAGISAEKAQEILDKKKLAAENVEQAKIAGSELYERVALGYAVTELNLGSGTLQLAMESPTTGNLTEKIKEGLAGLNPTPPKDEEMAIYDGIATKALLEKDFPAAVKALILATEDPNLEKPDVLKRLQDSTQGDQEEQLKLAQVLSELLPKKENNQTPEIITPTLESIPTPPATTETITPVNTTPIEAPLAPSPIQAPTPETASPIPTMTETPSIAPISPSSQTETITSPLAPTPTDTHPAVTTATIANEVNIPEPAAAPDLSGYALPQINAIPTEVPTTELNLAGTRPMPDNKTDLPDPYSAANTAPQPNLVEITAATTPPGLRPVPEQPVLSAVPNPDIKPSGIINKLPSIPNPFRKAA